MKVGSLFCGIGGIDVAFEREGFEITWANDNDKAVCKTYRHNFPTTPLYECNVRELDPRTLPDIDVLVAGFPCQPFSVMGYKKGFKDARGNLFFEISRFIDIKRPRFVLLENVKNLIDHDNGKTFLVIYNTLVQFGYTVRYRVINATDVNIPQNRARIFIVAFLDVNDCDKFEFPEPLELTATIEDLLDRNVKHEDCYYYDCYHPYFAELDGKIGYDGGIYRIDDSGIATRKWSICPTLKANMGTYPDRVPVIRDAFGIRKFTPMECLAFQGFPESFRFKGVTLESAYKQCGNTVCVPVVQSIAKQIKMLDGAKDL